MIPSFSSSKGKALLYGLLITCSLSFLSLVLYFLLPFFIPLQDKGKNIEFLRGQAQTVRKIFSSLLDDIREKKNLIIDHLDLKNPDDFFSLSRKLKIEPEKEGVALLDEEGKLFLWQGNVVDISPILAQVEELTLRRSSTLLVRHKASIYLVALDRIPSAFLVYFRLLAFLPPFKAPYLGEYQFLKTRLNFPFEVDYIDLREDVSGFEKIFSKYKDEYLSQAGPREETQTLFFPLRNESQRIVAAVTLTSSSRIALLARWKENSLFFFYLFLALALFIILLYLALSSSFYHQKKILTGLLIFMVIIVLRILLFPYFNLEKSHSRELFSPAVASFFSLGNLTQSPADIFFTSLFFLILVLVLSNYSSKILSFKVSSPRLTSLLHIICLFASSGFIFLFLELLSQLISNSNLNLLRFSFHLPFFFLHLSILFLFLSLSLLAFLGMRWARNLSPHRNLSFLFLLLFILMIFFIQRPKFHPLVFLMLSLFLFALLALTLYPEKFSKQSKRVFFFLFILATLFIYASLHHFSADHTHSLVQDFFPHTIRSQRDWAHFFAEQSLPEIEKKKGTIIAFLKEPKATDLAQTLWEKTLMAKFNWYSSLEIWNGEGEILSRFSLNIPRFLPRSPSLPLSSEWKTLSLFLPFMGKEKEFLVVYKDWHEEGEYLGRSIFYLSLDPEMLPFLFSANPYFDLLRLGSLPFLHQIDWGLAIFNRNGEIIFNPGKISSGLSREILQSLKTSSHPFWSTLKDKNRRYDAYYFPFQNRFYMTLLLKKNFINHTTSFLKLLFFYLFFVLLALFLIISLFPKKRFQNPFWSFSNRVYASLMAVALFPLLLFTFFTQNFFERLFAQQFVEKAELHANFARSMIEDFLYLFEEEAPNQDFPSENLVLWISSIIGTDVNLYQRSSLLSSSRREMFDSGILPELVDGEVYHQIQYHHFPYYAKRQKIGTYSFQTLTVPYRFRDSQLFISIPFPFEKQEINRATQELFEFLLFISAFFILLVHLFARSLGAMITSPVKKLLEGTREVSSGNLEVSLDYKSEDEMKNLIEGFNAMVQNLKKHQQELAEMSKKVAWAEMARRVAHEIKNPLTPIQLSAEHLLKVYDDRSGNFEQVLKESVSYIINEVENLRRIAQDFLERAKELPLVKEEFDLRRLLEEMIHPYKKMLAARIHFEETYERNAFPIVGDKSKLRVALRNIFTNAIESISGKGKIKVHLRQENKMIFLEISDTGKGMEEEILERIFEPYFSTKDIGTGLGLPIAKKIIEDHGGGIHISSKLKEGTRVTIHLPVKK